MVDVNMFRVYLEPLPDGCINIIIDDLSQLDTVDVTSEFVKYDYMITYQNNAYQTHLFKVEESDVYPGRDKITATCRQKFGHTSILK